MGLFLYLQIKPLEEIQFTHPFLDQVRQQLAELEILDADNHSDPFILDHISEKITSSNMIFLLIEAQSAVSPGAVLKIINQLVKAKTQQLTVFFFGEKSAIHRMLEKKANHFLTNPSLEKMAKAFTQK